jgi:hypothetical protein
MSTTLERRLVAGAGIVLAVAAVAIYLTSHLDRYYDHFVWQAAAFLEGHAAIRYPVPPDGVNQGNLFFQDVLPIATSDGVRRGLLPFPPLPAILLMPAVAIFGLATDDQRLFTILAGVDVALAYWMLGRLPIRLVVRLGTTVFFALGTVFWYTAQNATTWYQAHIVAIGLTFLAIGVALRADPAAVTGDEAVGIDARPAEAAGAHAEAADAAPADTAPADAAPADTAPADTAPEAAAQRRLIPEPRQVLAGLLLGVAATARLSMVLGAPFFLFVGAGRGWWRRAWSAALGVAIPVALLLGYNLVSSGQLVQPAYDYLYRLETAAYAALGYHADWSVEDPRYLPQNAAIMFLTPPDLLPQHLPDTLGFRATPVCEDGHTERGLFDKACPLAVPRDIGMSVLITSPALLLMLPALGWIGRRRLVTGSVVAIALIVLFNLMHFSQGWVQFGYRFSNDAIPFALPLVALGFERLVAGGRRWAMPLAMALVVVSIGVNAWGVAWGTLLGW